MKNCWFYGRAAVPRTLIFRTVRRQDLILKTWTKPNVWQSSDFNFFFNFQSFFRVQKQDIPVLANVLQLPMNIRCPQRTIWDRIEGLCMLLRFSYPWRYLDMISRFGRPVPELGMITNKVMDNIFNNHGHRISQWNDDVLQTSFQTFTLEI